MMERVVFGRKAKEGSERAQRAMRAEDGRRIRRRWGVEDVLMAIGSLVIVAYFALTLSGTAAESEDFDKTEAVAAAAVDVDFDTSERWSFWEYLSDCLEQIFTDKELMMGT